MLFRRSNPSSDAGNSLPPEWFRLHAKIVWRVVARLGVPAHSVDDVVQETFITASRRRHDIGEGQERSFLLATALRLAANYRRRSHLRHEVSHPALEHERSPDPDAEQLLIDKGLRELLERALQQLSDAHREVFVLYELECFSLPEIAELLGLPLGTVSSRVSRARSRFCEIAAALERTLLEKEAT